MDIKKGIAVVSFSAALLGVAGIQQVAGHADTAQPMTLKEKVDTAFSNFKDTDKVVPMPGGGFLYGTASAVTVDNNVLNTINSASDPTAITVAKAKKLMLKESQVTQNDPQDSTSSGITTFSLTPSNKPYSLTPGSIYTSEKFTSASTYAWDFSGYLFETADTVNGIPMFTDDLDWKSIGGPGRLGEIGEEVSTAAGTLEGHLITEKSTWTPYSEINEQGIGYYTNVKNNYYQVMGVHIK